MKTSKDRAPGGCLVGDNWPISPWKQCCDIIMPKRDYNLSTCTSIHSERKWRWEVWLSELVHNSHGHWDVLAGVLGEVQNLFVTILCAKRKQTKFSNTRHIHVALPVCFLPSICSWHSQFQFWTGRQLERLIHCHWPIPPVEGELSQGPGGSIPVCHHRELESRWEVPLGVGGGCTGQDWSLGLSQNPYLIQMSMSCLVDKQGDKQTTGRDK